MGESNWHRRLIPSSLLRYDDWRKRCYSAYEAGAPLSELMALQAQSAPHLKDPPADWVRDLVTFDTVVLGAVISARHGDENSAAVSLQDAILVLLRSPHLSSMGPDWRMCIPFTGGKHEALLGKFLDDLEAQWEFGGKDLRRVRAWVTDGNLAVLSKNSWKNFAMEKLFEE